MANGAVSQESNFGTLVDLYAPSWLVSAFGLNTTRLPDKIDFGDSFAAPLVTGTAGLL